MGWVTIKGTEDGHFKHIQDYWSDNMSKAKGKGGTGRGTGKRLESLASQCQSGEKCPKAL